MKLRAEDYANTARHSGRENALCRDLRRLSDEEITGFVLRLLELDPGWGLPIARRVLRRPEDVMLVLKLATELSDASTIKFWLAACLPKLGWKRLLDFVRDQIERNPEWVEDALYWLPQLCRTIPESSEPIERLREELDWSRRDSPQ